MLPILAMLSEWHIILALIIIFLLFGGRKLPELARGVGEAIKEFKKSQRDLAAPDDAHRPTSPTPPGGSIPPAAAAVTPPSATPPNGPAAPGPSQDKT